MRGRFPNLILLILTRDFWREQRRKRKKKVRDPEDSKIGPVDGSIDWIVAHIVFF